MANELTAIMAPSMGTRSGRIQPANYTPQDGSYVLCFGSDEPGVEADLDSGDYAQFTQTVEVTAITMLKFAVKFVQPDNSGAGMTFKLTVSVGARSFTWTPAQETTQEYVERSINVSSLTGWQGVTLKVEAV